MRLQQPVDEGVGKDEAEDGFDLKQEHEMHSNPHRIVVDRSGVVEVVDSPDVAHELVVEGGRCLLTPRHPGWQISQLHVQQFRVL